MWNQTYKLEAVMNYVYRKIRKGEQLKVNRLLMANGFIYRPEFEYHLVTTDNPKKKGKRLIVAAVGSLYCDIKQLTVAPKYKWTDALAFGLKKAMDENSTLHMRLRPEHIYAAITGGWFLEKYSRGWWTFKYRITEFKLLPKLPYINEKSMGIVVKPKKQKKTEPYILGEKVVSLWEFIKTDPEYRRFTDWKPTIQLIAPSLYDYLPMNKRIAANVGGLEADSRTLFNLVYPEIRDHTDGNKYPDFTSLTKWLDDKNVKATKRIQKYIYDEFKVKLSDRTLENINIHFRNSGAMGFEFEYEFVPAIDWRAGSFGDGSSCWLYPQHEDYDHHCHFSAALNSCGHGFAIKIWQGTKGIGRVFGSVENDSLFLFNYKCSGVLRGNAFFEIVAKNLRLTYTKPSTLYAREDPNCNRRDAYIESPFAVISRNPPSSSTIGLNWYKNGKKEIKKYYVPI